MAAPAAPMPLALLLDGGQVVLYADDLLLCRPIQTQEDYHHLQGDILMIEDWLNSNYLTLNLTKSGP